MNTNGKMAQQVLSAYSRENEKTLKVMITITAEIFVVWVVLLVVRG